jgi:trans-AT polyketide synthase/acyltransferase/oxidoreductase domain-containing protein
VEAGTSDVVKQMLQEAEVQDTAYAPAGDMFELGAKVQVLRRGLLFPPRANKLYELYQRYDSLAAIDPKTLAQLEEQYFHRRLTAVWEETRDYWQRTQPDEVARAESNPKYKMALVFKWYFVQTTRLAMRGDETRRVDFQVHCGPAMGAFNHWVKGTEIEPWRNRRVADIGKRLLTGAAEVLAARYAAWHAPEKHAGSYSNGRHHGDARANS